VLNISGRNQTFSACGTHMRSSSGIARMTRSRAASGGRGAGIGFTWVIAVPVLFLANKRYSRYHHRSVRPVIGTLFGGFMARYFVSAVVVGFLLAIASPPAESATPKEAVGFFGMVTGVVKSAAANGTSFVITVS